MKKEYIVKIVVLILVLSFILVALKVGLFDSDVMAKEQTKLVMLAKDNPEVGCGVYVYRYYTGTGFCDFVVVSRQYQGGVAVTQLR